MSTMIDIQEMTIRLADAEDHTALERLAQRDSATVPAAPLLVAASGDDLIAAASLADGRLIADPFRRSAGAAKLLVERAKLLDAEMPDRHGLHRGSGYRAQQTA